MTSGGTPSNDWSRRGLRRREWIGCSATVGFTALASAAAQTSATWDSVWDGALLKAAVSAASGAFDAPDRMIRTTVGPEYRYHSALRSQAAHPTRESLHFALLLLEQKDEKAKGTALGIIDRVLALQETDPASKWYGLWGWYLEEPAPAMQPADWNWADFLGSLLLLIRKRHSDALGDGIRARVEVAIRHAAYSVMRRNVSMGYTNIAIKGTFVTLAAAELLEDRTLLSYARERLLRFSAEVDRTGSYNEYNSPTYNRVGIENFTRMRMLWSDPEAIAQALRLEERMWDHFSRRWHVGTRQLAGPMSRCYSTDIGKPLWLQKALRNAVMFATLEEIQAGKTAGDAEASYLDFRCPSQFVERFVKTGAPRTVREIFLAADPKGLPTHGTTWLTPGVALGSVSQGDLWTQRRPLLLWLKGPGDHPVSVRLRLMKDDYDFSSARIYNVQQENRVLAVINFQSPGGDKHISLDPIDGGRFAARSLRLQIDINGGPVAVAQAHSPNFPDAHGRSTTVRLFRFGDQRLRIRCIVCGGLREDGVRPYESGIPGQDFSLHCPWFGSETWATAEPRQIDWGKTAASYAVFHLEVLPVGSTRNGDTGQTSVKLEQDVESGTVKVEESGYGENLSLVAGVTVESAAIQNERFDGGKIGGRAVAWTRLSDVPLAGLFHP